MSNPPPLLDPVAPFDARFTGSPGPEVGPLPLAAIAYAADANALALSFGVPNAGGPELTRLVRGVTAVDRLVDPGGADRALLVTGADGAALLRFL